MRAQQGKIRERVIEGFPVELNDIAITPDMIAMAMAAVLLHGIQPAAMISLARRTVRGNLLVTCKTKVRL